MKDLNQIQMELFVEVANDLGFGTSDDFRKLEANNEWVELFTKNIDPQLLGPFAPAIESMTVTVSVGIGKQGHINDGNFVGYLKYDYSYKHPNGSNGYQVRKQIS